MKMYLVILASCFALNANATATIVERGIGLNADKTWKVASKPEISPNSSGGYSVLFYGLDGQGNKLWLAIDLASYADGSAMANDLKKDETLVQCEISKINADSYKCKLILVDK